MLRTGWSVVLLYLFMHTPSSFLYTLLHSQGKILYAWWRLAVRSQNVTINIQVTIQRNNTWNPLYTYMYTSSMKNNLSFIALSCSEYLNHKLLKIIACYWSVVGTFLLIDTNQWIILIDFQYWFLLVNYTWHYYRHPWGHSILSVIHSKALKFSILFSKFVDDENEFYSLKSVLKSSTLFLSKFQQKEKKHQADFP